MQLLKDDPMTNVHYLFIYYNYPKSLLYIRFNSDCNDAAGVFPVSGETDYNSLYPEFKSRHGPVFWASEVLI